MWCHRLIPITTMACAAVLAFSACNRKPAAPELQTTTGVQPRAESVSLTGCLQRGVIADDTFVLLVSQTAGNGTTATYQLTARPELNLRDHVGEQIEVSGTLRSEQEFTSAAGAVKEQPAKGTSGTPTVETKSDVNVRRLDAQSVRPLGSRCQQ